MQQLLQQQRKYFDSGATLSSQFRIQQLRKLYSVIKAHETDILYALRQDLGKPETEAYVGEIGPIYNEIDLSCKNLAKWIRPHKVKSPLNQFYSKSYIQRVALGCVLIIAPWNYPFQLLISPLIGAIAAGNCVMLKPSELSINTARILEIIIKEAFNEEYIAIQNGDGAVIVTQLIELGSFNHVLFTGSTAVGRIIAKQCAEKLIPYTLELGGKSPAVIDSSANLEIAARRVVWGKFFNTGQTCIAPDYLLIDSQVYSRFIELLQSSIIKFGLNILENNGKIINKRQFERLTNYLTDAQIVTGGKYDEQQLKIEPTLLLNPCMDSKVMTDEIFGPILPIITYTGKTELINTIRHHRYPLSMYIFSEDKVFYQELIEQIECGGVGINTCLYHFANKDLPFGGVMTSGNGQYHGKFSFDLFSHPKAVVKTFTWPDITIKYPPYNKLKLSLIKMLS